MIDRGASRLGLSPGAVDLGKVSEETRAQKQDFSEPDSAQQLQESD